MPQKRTGIGRVKVQGLGSMRSKYVFLIAKCCNVIDFVLPFQVSLLKPKPAICWKQKRHKEGS